MKNIKVGLIVMFCLMIQMASALEPVGETIVYDNNLVFPPPTAFELGKYGFNASSDFTGKYNVNIPIMTYNAGSLSIPISLNYCSSGIQVNQYPTNVGLGWSLFTGGVITRIVRDEPDESSTLIYPEEPISSGSLYTNEKYEFLTASVLEDADSESDIFMYNFNGYSGKFVYTNEKAIATIPYNKLIIEPMCVEDDVMFYQITTPDGVKYIFDKIERTKNSSNPSGIIPFRKNFITTSWFLSKIIHPEGDEILIDYLDLSYNFESSTVQRLTRPIGGNRCSSGNSCDQFSRSLSYSITDMVRGKKISKIYSNNPFYGSIDFEYYSNSIITAAEDQYLIKDIIHRDKDQKIVNSASFVFLQTTRDRLFLETIQFNQPGQIYKFDYIEPGELCPRNSHAIDHWGYYNGASNNQYLIPHLTNYDGILGNYNYGNREPNNLKAQKGLLSQITFPTKGYTTFEYEANSYLSNTSVCYGESVRYLEAYAKYIDVSDRRASAETASPISHKQEKVPLSLNVKSLPDFSNTDEKISAKVTIRNKLNQNYASIFKKTKGGIWLPDSNPMMFSLNDLLAFNFSVDLVEGVTYELIIEPMFEQVEASAMLQYNYRAIPCETQNNNVITGGSRIKKVVNFESNNKKATTLRYYYNYFDGDYTELDKSSGDVPYLNYVNYRIQKLNCAYSKIEESQSDPGLYMDIDCPLYDISSNTVIPQFSSGSSNIYYKYVTVSHGGDNFENGGETHEYIINRDTDGEILLGNDVSLSTTRFVNSGWNHGLEKEVEIFSFKNNVKKLEQEKFYEYFPDESNKVEVYSYATSKNFDPRITGDINYICKACDIEKTYKHITCVADHSHVLFLFGNEPKCIARGYNNQTYYTYHPCFGHKEGDIITWPDNLKHLNVVEYKNISQWSYLKQEKTKQYFNDNTEVLLSSDFEYNNAKHCQISAKTTINSKGESIKEKYWYPQDFNNIENFSTLISKGIISKPVKIETFTNLFQTGGKLLKYNDFGQLSKLYNYESTALTPESLHNPEALSTILDKYSLLYENTYYPVSKKLFQKISSDGITTSYKWGYGEAYPIEKTITGLYGMSLTEYWDWYPLIGMKYHIDQTGLKIFYDYDSFGRLIRTKNKDGEILNQYEYQFAGQANTSK